MTYAFNPHQGLVIVRAEIAGSTGSSVLRLALDTGATSTMINAAMLIAIGHDPALYEDRIQVTTGSSVEYVPRVTLKNITALGRDRAGFPVLSHTLPTSAGVDGLLGVDFSEDRH